MRASYRSIPIAIAICAAAPAFADAQSQVQAARKAERRGEWKKALEGWKAAYAADVNAEYLIGIGDCYARMGNSDEARKNYNAYLADPLALPANVVKVKAKVASLDSAGGALALPGGGLALPGADSPPPLPLAAPLPLPGLDLPGSAPAVAEEKGRKGKHKKGSDAAPPGLELPGAQPAQVAENKPEGGRPLPSLDLPAFPPSKKEAEKKVVSASPGFELPAASQLSTKPDKKEPPAVATNMSPNTHISTGPANGKQVAMATTSSGKPAEQHRVPEAAIAETPVPRPADSGVSRTVGWIAGGAAVASLAAGGFTYLKGSSSASALTNGTIRSGSANQALVDDANRNHLVGFVALAGGLVLAGLSAALIAF